jgi:hypothetical protein
MVNDTSRSDFLAAMLRRTINVAAAITKKVPMLINSKSLISETVSRNLAMMGETNSPDQKTINFPKVFPEVFIATSIPINKRTVYIEHWALVVRFDYMIVPVKTLPPLGEFCTGQMTSFVFRPMTISNLPSSPM